MPIAYVTGAAGGLGTAISRALVEAGYQLAIFDVSVDALAERATELGAAAIAFQLDITDRQAVDTAITKAEQQVGAPDLLVNNAGTFSVCAPMWECDPDLWFRDININLFGTFLMCNRITGGMVSRKSGRIVNIVSSGGVLDGHPYGTAYAASKTGVTRMTEGLAHELEPHGVQAFAVGPPAVLTNMTKFLIEDETAQKYRPLIKSIFEKGEDHPPEVVAGLVIALASGRADKLSGRYFLPHKDYEAIIADAETVVEQDLWTLRIKGHKKGA